MKAFGPSDDPVHAAKHIAKYGVAAIQGGPTIVDPYITKVFEELRSYPNVDPVSDAVNLSGKGHQYCIYDLNKFGSRNDPNLYVLLDSVI